MTIKLRGHHLKNIEFNLLKRDRDGLRFTGEFDYELNFAFLKDMYPGKFTRDLWRMHNYIVKENPPIKIINTCDDICRLCPHLEKESMKCRDYNMPERYHDELKGIDDDCINYLGLTLGKKTRFSTILRIIVDKNYESFGFKDFNEFIKNIDDILHPKLVELYYYDLNQKI